MYTSTRRCNTVVKKTFEELRPKNFTDKPTKKKNKNNTSAHDITSYTDKLG